MSNWTWWSWPGWLWLWSCGHGGRLPNQLLMSPEIVRYIEEAEEHTQKKDKLKQEKDEFVKQALAEKSKKTEK